MNSSPPLLSSLTIFFPCYNEEKNIGALVAQAQKIAPSIAAKYEIMVINDGSVDNTANVIRELMETDEHITLLEHKNNLGYGSSLRSGFQHATCEWVFFTDGDAQFSLKHLREFASAASKSDVVIGYRIKRAEGSLRALNARMFKFFIDALFRVHVKDIDCAFKLFKTNVIASLPLESTGAMISAEILYRLKKKHVQLIQLPVEHYPRMHGQPSGNNLRVILKAFYEAFRLYISMKKQSLHVSTS